MMTPEDREKAYERYELYRGARARWEINTLKPFTITFLFWGLGLIAIIGFRGGISLFMNYIFIGIPVAIVIGLCISHFQKKMLQQKKIFLS